MSKAEDLLELHLRADKIEYQREVKCIPGRNFRFDFMAGGRINGSSVVYTEKYAPVLVEVQGGVWLKGRSAHSSGEGLTRDAEKLSLAAVNHFRTIVVTPAQVKSGQAIAWIKQALQ